MCQIIILKTVVLNVTQSPQSFIVKKHRTLGEGCWPISIQIVIVLPQ